VPSAPPAERDGLAGPGVLPLATARARLGALPGALFTELLRHGTLSVEVYAPRGIDAQQPHSRDEVYVVASGSGEFVCGERRERFVRGDLIFVPAGMSHRFLDFSADLAVWVIFYGPEGGEQP
jgi:mannose-6-phosphate isomerase-like protein (cupin superfamily)